MASILKRRGKRGEVYYLVYRLNGRQKWKKAGKNYAVAKLKLKELEYKLEIGDLDEFLRKEKPISFSQFAKERYLPWMETRRAKKTYSYAKNSCVHLLKFFRDATLAQITPKMIEDYIKQRKDKVKPRTINLELTCLQHLFNRALEEKYCLRGNPVKRVEKLKVPKRHPRFLSKEEMQRLWQEASPWVRIFIVVASHSGMRAGEISNLRWVDIDWVRNVIKVPLTKTGSEREIPMEAFLRQTLVWFKDNYIDFRRMIIMPRKPEQMDYVFCDYDGSKLESFRGGFIKARARAGLTDITIHTLRHTYASHWANKGVSLLTIKDLLGHTDIKTTTIYAHLSNEHLQNAVKNIDYQLGPESRLLLNTKK